MAFTGLYVPLVTPFTDDDQLDCDSLTSLANRVLDEGAAGIVALGTTGEPATLSPREARQVVDVCGQICCERGRHLIVGAGSNDTRASSEIVSALGPAVTAALAMVPYFTRPSQDGIVQHFQHLASATAVPLIVYNVPYRTSLSLTVDTLHRLAELQNVVGFKHSVGAIDDATISFMSQLDPGVAVLAGDDLYAGPLVALGASGAIMASANVATRAYAALIKAWREGPTEQARSLHNELVPFTRTLFAEPNPAVVKSVLAARGGIGSPRVRLPLLPATKAATAAALSCCPQF